MDSILNNTNKYSCFFCYVFFLSCSICKLSYTHLLYNINNKLDVFVPNNLQCYDAFTFIFKFYGCLVTCSFIQYFFSWSWVAFTPFHIFSFRISLTLENVRQKWMFEMDLINSKMSFFVYSNICLIVRSFSGPVTIAARTVHRKPFHGCFLRDYGMF